MAILDDIVDALIERETALIREASNGTFSYFQCQLCDNAAGFGELPAEFPHMPWCPVALAKKYRTAEAAA